MNNVRWTEVTYLSVSLSYGKVCSVVVTLKDGVTTELRGEPMYNLLAALRRQCEPTSPKQLSLPTA